MGSKTPGSLKSTYLERYAATGELIHTPPPEDLGIIITIPSYKEEHLLRALTGLSKTTKPGCSVEVIVLINHPEKADEETKEKSKKQYEELNDLTASLNNDFLRFYILLQELSSKHAGVGLARKIIMDEAVRRFESISHAKGIIAAYDADCTCEANYLVTLEEFFQQHPQANGCSIYYEHHPDEEYDLQIYQAVYEYELHLRCYIDALRWCGLPHAFQTIGSSMAVNHKIYQQQGGMNRKKAGEDFYFLHRIIPLGEFGDLTTTTIYPSIRPSDRVPFGTGKAVNKWLGEKKQFTYHPACYPPLRSFTDLVPQLYKVGNETISHLLNQIFPPLAEFLNEQGFEKEIERINTQSTSEERFIKHFYQWFNGFLVMKYLHFIRDHYYEMIPVKIAAKEILEFIAPTATSEDLLSWYRKYDREHQVYLKKL